MNRLLGSLSSCVKRAHFHHSTVRPLAWVSCYTVQLLMDDPWVGGWLQVLPPINVETNIWSWMAGFCEHSSGPLVFFKRIRFLNQLRNYKCSKKPMNLRVALSLGYSGSEVPKMCGGSEWLSGKGGGVLFVRKTILNDNSKNMFKILSFDEVV
jgi:hypothetical protein